MIRLILRVSNRRGGLGESNLLRLYHAFLMSHINYVAAALDWSRTQETKVDTLMRKSIKRVLGIPITASTERLMQLGVHNTLAEVVEAQNVAQAQRLLTTRAGRHILQAIGYNVTDFIEHNVTLSPRVRDTFSVAPLPRNVHPQHNVGRRTARARALLRSVSDCATRAVFVDVAQYGNSNQFVAVTVDPSGNLLNSASVKTLSATVAEQVAIALAMKDPQRPNIYTDSRSAARAFSSGTVSREAATILGSQGAVGFHTVTWFPAHMGDDVHPDIPNANELANDCARGFTSRGSSDRQAAGRVGEYRDPLLTFHEIISHYHLSRRIFPLPHAKLTHPQSAALRMLQTGSFPSRSRFSLFLPGVEPNCPNCNEACCSLIHMLWQCPALRDAEDFKTKQDWERALKSEDLQVQQRAVQRACERAESLGLPPPAQVRPATATGGP